MTAMTKQEYDQITNRQRRLPSMLERARRRVNDLEKEARRLSMHELLTEPRHVNAAWDRAIDEARNAVPADDVA
jgi:hypothetical protein